MLQAMQGVAWTLQRRSTTLSAGVAFDELLHECLAEIFKFSADA
jgi:hypothetical protein